MSESGEEHVDGGFEVSGKLLTLLLVGFALINVGVIVLVVGSFLVGGSSSVGGVIFIGPFPIVFGAGPDAVWLIVVSVIVAVVVLVLFFLLRRRSLEEF